MGKKKKRKKPQTMGEMTGTRTQWYMNPVTRIKESKKKYNRKRNKNKQNMED